MTSRKGRDHAVMTGILRGVRHSLALPLLLIAVGVLSFAANMGYVDPASVRAFVRMSWPTVLVLIGVEILFARTNPFPRARRSVVPV